MLQRYERGYAVMNKELNAYSFEDRDFETCKKYCRPGYVIVERIPKVCGFCIRVWWSKYSDGIRYNPRTLSLWHLNIQLHNEYCHKCGKVVYTAPSK